MKKILQISTTVYLLAFTMQVSAQVTDIDGNVYQTVTIGTQVWMKENLRTTKLNDGTAIPNVTDNTAWAALTTPGYSWHINNGSNENTYGVLYNWYTVNTGKLCPTGWHVPSDAEWTTLSNFVGGDNVSGGKLKETGIVHWNDPNTGATDEVSFSAVGGGLRDGNGLYVDFKNNGFWWTSNEASVQFGIHREMYNTNTRTDRVDSFDKKSGFSVRCIKNNISDGLVAYYPFNGNANDESGNGNNGTVNGPILATDRFGSANSAYSFDGINDYISSAYSKAQGQNFTINVWAKGIGIMTCSKTETYESYFSYGHLLTPSFYQVYHLGIYGDPVSDFASEVTGYGDLSQKFAMFTVIGSSTGQNSYKAQLYLDGRFIAEKEIAYKVPGWQFMEFGRTVVENNGYYDGIIDDIRIYNRILSNTEIYNLYHENGYANPPILTSFSPTYGPTGTSVTITGTSFSNVTSENIVWFGAAKATVTAATSTQLTVTVPPGSTYKPISVTVNGLTAYSSKPFNVTFPSAQALDASSFANKADLTTGNTPTFVAIGDIDSDGKPDLAVTNQNSNTISVFRNISTSGLLTTGSFAAKVDFATAANPVGIDIGDIDSDGKPDIVVTNNGASSVSVFQNQSTSGSISLAARIDLTTGGNPTGVAVRDFDLDGINDIAVVNNSGSSVSIIRNISQPGPLVPASFLTKVDFPVGAGPILPAVSDYDGDGKPDIAVTNYTSNTISILKNTSTPGIIDASSFATKVDLTTGTGPYAIAAGDIDSDGKTDIVVANYNVNTVSVFRNVSTSGSITSGSFEAKVDFPATRVEFISIGDIDGDGKPDLVVPNYNGALVAVLKNNSVSGTINSSSFAAKVEFTTGTAPWGAGICDLDGDGKPDIVVANAQSTSLSLFRNTIADTPPVTAPVIGTITHPTCAVATGSVTLSGLPSSGTWTLTRSPGNTTTQGTGTTTTISGLASGTYSYTVTDTYGGISAASSSIVINTQPSTPAAPVAGIITQPTCTTPAGSVDIGGLPSSGTWTLTITPGSSTTGTGTNAPVQGLAPGTYSFSVTNADGCTSLPLSGIVIQPVPVGNIPVIGLKWNSVLVCYNLNKVFSSWVWYKDNNPLATTGKSFYNTDNSPGMYKVQTTDKDGCRNFSNIIQVSAGARSFTAYPNPAGDNITLSLTDESRGKASAVIYDNSGIKVMELVYNKTEDDLLEEIHVNQLGNGAYTIRLTINSRNEYFTRIVISR